MTRHRIYTTNVASVYPYYIAKAERKGRNKKEVNGIIRWLTGLICGVRVQDIKEPTMQEIRYLDKLIDELAKGKAQPPYVKLTEASSSAPPGACITPSRVINVVAIIFLIT